MAVEAHRPTPIFSSQFLPNREILNPVEANVLIHSTQMRYGAVPLLGSTMMETGEVPPLNPMYNIAGMDYLIAQNVKPAIQSVDSSVTFNGDRNKSNDLLLPVSSSVRKRSREDSVIVNPPSMPRSTSYLPCQKPCSDPLMFLGHDVSLSVQQQQLDVDRLISHHMERMRREIEEKRRRQGRRIMEAIEQGLMRRLREKEEEMEKIGKLNQFLEEKVKSLSVENQIWRDLAQSNEATAKVLRTNLEQVLAAVEPTSAEVAEDAESCCGSSDEDRKRVGRRRRECRWCGEGEACVLLLPCRHLCLCTLCGSSVHTCPICNSPKKASLHVNLSC